MSASAAAGIATGDPVGLSIQYGRRAANAVYAADFGFLRIGLDFWKGSGMKQ